MTRVERRDATRSDRGDDRDAVDAIGHDVPFVIRDDRLAFTVRTTPAAIRRIVVVAAG